MTTKAELDRRFSTGGMTRADYDAAVAALVPAKKPHLTHDEKVEQTTLEKHVKLEKK